MNPSQDDAQLDIEALPAMLNFHEDKAPILERTHERIVEAARTQSVDRAEAAANTYHELAEALVENQLKVEHRNLPKPIQKHLRTKARLGILIKLADIWNEAGVTDRCLRALERAITYARRMHWESIATMLEGEKQKLQSASG